MLSKQAALKYTGTHRTFPVLRNVPGKVPLFLVSSVFPYSKRGTGKVWGTFIFPAILYLPKLKKIYKFKKI